MEKARDRHKEGGGGMDIDRVKNHKGKEGLRAWNIFAALALALQRYNLSSCACGPLPTITVSGPLWNRCSCLMTPDPAGLEALGPKAGIQLEFY